VASLSQGRTAAAQCGLFTHKSVPVIFEPPCIPSHEINYEVTLAPAIEKVRQPRPQRGRRSLPIADGEGSFHLAKHEPIHSVKGTTKNGENLHTVTFRRASQL